ncbi:recombinase family protein, partial [Neobacillus vireti]|uniref:recombinase family protein n=1 Tax=Neobacillus vireti TaxID=220686 RepID=UPI002FFF1EDB
MVISAKRAAIFMRRSIEDKVNEKVSLSYQEKMCRDKAQELGYEIVEVVTEEVSAYNVSIQDRPKLQYLLNAAMDGDIEAVVCWQKSRLVRSLEDIIVVTEVFNKSNCEVVFADPGELPMGKGGDIDILMSIISTWRDEAEVAKLRSRIKSHLRQRAKDGKYVGGTFTGYEWNKHTKRMDFVPGEIEMVKEIFHLYLYEGLTVKQIAQLLNEQGYKTKKMKIFKPYSVVSILKTKIYSGYYRWGFSTSKRRSASIAAEGYENKVNWVEPIISLEDWNKVQEIMISRSGKKRGSKNNIIPKSSFLLSDKVFCGLCGKKMFGRNGCTTYKKKDGTKKETQHYRYICNDTSPHPYSKRVDSKLLDFFVFQHLAMEIKNLDKETLFKDAKNELKTVTKLLQDEMKESQRKIEKIGNAIENLLINIEKTTDVDLVKIYGDRIKEKKIDAAEYKEKIRVIEKKLKTIQVDNRDLEEFLDYFSSIDGYNEFTQEKKRLYIDNLVEKVVVNGHVATVTLRWNLKDKSSFENLANIDYHFDL